MARTIDLRMDGSATASPGALLEREHEVECIRGALRAVGQRAGETLIVEGAAGIGKSRLLEEARAWGADHGVRVLSARATELERGFPFGVIRQLLERPLLEADAGDRGRWLAGAAALAEDVITGAPGSGSFASRPSVGDPGYAWQHGLYWLASNLSADLPLALLVDDLQWCDAPSARALAFIERRLEGQPLGLIVATRPLDPALSPEAAALAGDPGAQLLRPLPLTHDAIADLVAGRLSQQPDELFVRACRDVTGGNPFLVGELLDEAAARRIEPTADAVKEIRTIVPRGVANAVLVRVARLAPPTAALARALSVLGDGAQIGDAARVAGLGGSDVETAMAALVSAGVVESGGSARFVHPILRTAIYEDLSPAERERLHRTAAGLLRDRGAPAGQVAAQAVQTEPVGDPEVVALLRNAASERLALGDAAGAAVLLSRALDEPPTEGERSAVLLELGQAHARAGATEAIGLLTEIVERGEDPGEVAAAAIELSGMQFFAGRVGEGAAILRRAENRLPAGEPARAQLEVALLGICYTSVSARIEADASIADLRVPDPSARGPLSAATLTTLAMDEVMNLGSAGAACELAERALADSLPPEPHHAWTCLTISVLAIGGRGDVARRHADMILAEARECGAALTVATILAHRAYVDSFLGDLTAAEADAQAAIELATDVGGSQFVLALAVPVAVNAGLDRDVPTESLRRLIDTTGVHDDAGFLAHALVRHASGVLRAAAGNHQAAIEELQDCARDHPMFGGENPAFVPWRSAAALSLAELGRDEEARKLAADEVCRARSFGASHAIGVALRAKALVGPAQDRAEGLAEALGVLEHSPSRLEHARALLDLGATVRATGKRTAAKEPLLEALALAGRCGARTLVRRARAELAAIGVRPRTTDHDGVDSLTPSERRVVELAATGDTNRNIAQTLFVTEKTVETHLGRAFRKLDVSSRRQLPEVLARATA